MTLENLLGRARNLSDYSGDPVSDAMAQESVAYASAFLKDIEAWLQAQR